jgi:hypothetical protein
LCLLGDPVDRDVLSAEVFAARELCPWLGWYGSADHVPILVAALREKLAQGATYDEIDHLARALERIGGERLPRLGEATRETFDARLTEWATSLPERRPANAARLRHCRAWTPLAVLDELSDPKTRQADRPTLARELSLITSRAVHVDVNGWVEAQRHDLTAARDLVSRLG